MYVLFLIDTLKTGGAEKSLLDILSRLKRYKPVVCYVYQGDQLREEFEKRNIPVVSLGVRGKKNYGEAISRLMPVIEKYNPVLVHATLYRSEIISRRLKTVIKVPLVNSFVNNRYTAERYGQIGLPGKVALYYYQFCDRITAGKVDMFFSNSRSIMINNASALKVPESKVRIIPRGRDMKKFSIEAIDATIGENGFLKILTVGRLLSSKGHADLIKAFAKIHNEFPSARLEIAGEGPNRSNLESLVSSLDLSNKVTLLGNRSDIPALLHGSDLFVFPSHYEGLPGALIEAMMAGKIIIASDIAENLECVNKETAIIFKKGNVDELATCLRKILPDPSEFTHYGTAARRYAGEHFDIDAVAEKYEETYDEILSVKK